MTLQFKCKLSLTWFIHSVRLNCNICFQHFTLMSIQAHRHDISYEQAHFTFWKEQEILQGSIHSILIFKRPIGYCEMDYKRRLWGLSQVPSNNINNFKTLQKKFCKILKFCEIFSFFLSEFSEWNILRIMTKAYTQHIQFQPYPITTN